MLALMTANIKQKRKTNVPWIAWWNVMKTLSRGLTLAGNMSSPIHMSIVHKHTHTHRVEDNESARGVFQRQWKRIFIIRRREREKWKSHCNAVSVSQCQWNSYWELPWNTREKQQSIMNLAFDSWWWGNRYQFICSQWLTPGTWLSRLVAAPCQSSLVFLHRSLALWFQWLRCPYVVLLLFVYTE